MVFGLILFVYFMCEYQCLCNRMKYLEKGRSCKIKKNWLYIVCIINNNNYVFIFINLLLFIWLFEEKIDVYLYINSINIF